MAFFGHEGGFEEAHAHAFVLVMFACEFGDCGWVCFHPLLSLYRVPRLLSAASNPSLAKSVRYLAVWSPSSSACSAVALILSLISSITVPPFSMNCAMIHCVQPAISWS